MTLIADRSERLDKFLSRMMPEHSRSKLAAWIEGGNVQVENRIHKPSFSLAPGMSVAVEPLDEKAPHDLTPADIPLDVIYEDEFLLVVNKPRGLAVHPAASLKEPSLVNALLARTHGLSSVGEAFRPGIVHRLDKDTTGLIVVAKTDTSHVGLARQIELKTATRRYVAVTAGAIDPPAFDVVAPIARSKRNRMLMAVDPGGKSAITHFKRLAHLAEGTLIAAALETGRTHQIRVHLQSMGHPVLGDRLYAPREYRSQNLQLHAAYLSFTHPILGELVEVYAPPPEDFLGRDFVSRKSVCEFSAMDGESG